MASVDFPEVPIPVLDISPFFSESASAEEKQKVAHDFDQAFRKYGFACISGHGVDMDIVNRVEQEARNFFSQPAQEKTKFNCSKNYGNGGYTGLKSETVSVNGVSDHVESVEFRGNGNEMVVPCEGWNQDFMDAVKAYWGQVEGLSMRILKVAAAALEVPENFFDEFYNPIQMDLRLANYPCVKDRVEIPDATMGYGAHTDYTGFTVLKADYEVQGLQVLLPGETTWKTVIPPEGTFIINSGDLIGIWTNDRWPSVVHRVLPCGPLPDGRCKDRLSLVSFTGPNYASQIECVPTCVGEGARYKPVNAGEHFQQRLVAGRYKGDDKDGNAK
ncbi:hypothetical protein PTSG_05733 [Salpingoeca rosetta]|uniref:Fe2OG dioxygenase domain-containing protein n=1 Tax=Salpingoeca rosetta (strain ATCC 50818 / BSB-021) TaxID=946362 RepID=F2UB26_SALR5|nr:uncharacterized protein PTSG_05733 [Salpingoeca rosetta]EGD74039.1 hypothetical protein PTSG_05733 [Salpingoeca rosetta]|eukprot:XP_004993601.1 hypothetical protein PTSG_05733 [Salpingoeca rosetta]